MGLVEWWRKWIQKIRSFMRMTIRSSATASAEEIIHFQLDKQDVIGTLHQEKDDFFILRYALITVPQNQNQSNMLFVGFSGQGGGENPYIGISKRLISIISYPREEVKQEYYRLVYEIYLKPLLQKNTSDDSSPDHFVLQPEPDKITYN